MAIELAGQFGKVHIYNIYDSCKNDHTLHFLEWHMCSEQTARRQHNERIAQGNHHSNEHIVWLGDFNRHHPMWELEHNTNLDAAGVLINLLSLYDLTQILPAGIATLEASNSKNHTRPDNVFCSEDLEQAFSQCDIKHHLRPIVTDHFPIISTLDLNPEHINVTPCLNYHDVDWDEFNEVLANKLDTIGNPAELTAPKQFENALTTLTQVIADTVEEKVPQVKPSPYAKRWWTKDLGQEQKAVHKMGRQVRDKIAQQNHPIHKEFFVARNKFSESIKKAKETHWNEWLDTLTSTGVWNFHRYATSNPADQIHTRIKTLKDPQDEQAINSR